MQADPTPNPVETPRAAHGCGDEGWPAEDPTGSEQSLRVSREPDAASTPSPREAARGRSAEHWILLATAIAATAGVLVLTFGLEADARGFGTHERLGLPPCRMMQWTGVPCPGCGVTTSVTLATHGRFFESFVNQPFGLLVALVLPVALGWAFLVHARGRDLYAELKRLARPRRVLWTIGLMIAAWIYKIAITVA